jgi:hypothetical protein
MKRLLLFFIVTLSFAGCKENELGSEKESVGHAGKSNAQTAAAGSEFTIAVIPDTQYYVSGQFGGTPAMFTAQIDWIKANQAAENIVYVASLGDITDHGDGVVSEWTNATTHGYYKLETQAGFTNGIPYGTCVGNHDQTPNTGHPLTCSTAKYNTYFGANRFRPRAYYGENYAGTGSNNNDSHYDLFTAGGIDFIVIYVEYDSAGEDWTNMNNWVYNLLGTFAARKAIVVTHYTLGGSSPTIEWGAQGLALYNRIKSRNNVFMMLGGHITGDRALYPVFDRNTISSIEADYQAQTNGGNGYMRLHKISVSNNTMSVKTYSPHLNLYKTGAASQFTVPLFTPAVNPDTPPATPVADGKYRITNVNSGRVIGVASGSTAAGAQLVQWDWVPTAPNQHWNISKIGTTGYYRITNVGSGRDMNISGASYLNGAKVVQWTYYPAAPFSDEWTITDMGSGSYKICNRYTGLGLNVDGGSTANGAHITTWINGGVPSQLFQLAIVP